MIRIPKGTRTFSFPIPAGLTGLTAWLLQAAIELPRGTAALLERRRSLLLCLVIVLLLAGGGKPTDLQTRARQIRLAAGLPLFNFAAWEVHALGQELRIRLFGAQARLSEAEETRRVRAYLARAQEIGQLERSLNQALAASAFSPLDVQEEAAQQARLAELRQLQRADRPAVEAILQRQVQEELARAGLDIRGRVLPPVAFSFTEPPKKLTVSRRDRIETVYSRMVEADADPLQVDAAEQAILSQTNLSGYVSRVGGLGVYPAMVVDQASLSWILSTIAHEWVHNYLTFFPLGLRYGSSGELTIINETVADIVGNEIGRRLARRYYPDALPPAPEPRASTQANPDKDLGIPPAFDFAREMRETRLRLDGLLAAGLVETAEDYMEARRRFFVAHGYPLRVLNQAYFAFHGNYATGAAASSPLGPQLVQLREQSLDVAHFLEQVRWFTSAADVSEALQ